MSRDVTLVIRAKDQAKKAVDSVADALRELTDVQKNVGESAAKTDGLLGRLKQELGALDREARGLIALGKVSSQLDKATAAVARLEDAAQRSAEDQAKLAGRMEAVATEAERLRSAAAAAKTAYDAERATLASLTKEHGKNAEAVAASRQRRDALKTTLTQANAASRTAVSAESALRREVEAGALAMVEASAATDTARRELAEITDIARQASSALGGVEATQEGVAAASARAADDIAKLNAAMAARSGAQSQTNLPGTAAETTALFRRQIAAVAEAKAAWRDAQAEANRLGSAIRQTNEPTREQHTAFLLAQAASRAAKQAYIEQGASLNALRGSLRGATAAVIEQNVAVRANQAAFALSNSAFVGHGAAVRQSVQTNALASAGIFRMRDAFRGLYGESRQAMNLSQRLRAEVLSLTSAYVGLYAVIGAAGKVLKAFQGLEAAQSRLGVVFNQNMVRTAAEIAFLREQSDRLGIAFSVLSDEYGKFAFAASAANFEIEDTRKTFLALAESGRVMKVSQENMAGLFKALTQIMSKGKVQAEELRGQIGDRMSGAFQIFAAAIGVTSQELDKMMEQGEVFADRSTIIKFADELERRFGPQLGMALQSINAEIGRFANNVEQAQLRIARAGFAERFGETLKSLNAWFASDDAASFFDGLGVALGKIVSLLPPIVENMDALAVILKGLFAFKVAQGFLGLFGNGTFAAQVAQARVHVNALIFSLGILASTARGPAAGGLMVLGSALMAVRGAAAAAIAAFRMLWVAVGGLPGILLSGAIYLVTSMLGDWLTTADRATEALQRHERQIEKVRNAYVEAGGKVNEWANNIKGLTLTELEINADDLRKTLDAIRDEVAGELAVVLMDGFSKTPPKELRDLVGQFKAGAISARDFKLAVNEIAQADPGLDRGLIKQMLEAADKADSVEKALGEVSAAARVLGSTASDSDLALLGLSDALGTLNANADTAALDRYTAALNRMKAAIPDVARQLKFDEDRKEIEKQFQAAIENAGYDLKAIALAITTRKAAIEALQREFHGKAASGSLVDRIVGAESGGDSVARNPNSSATGLGQFVEATWLRMFKQYFPDQAAGMTEAAMLVLREDADLSRKMVELYLQENAKALQAAGHAVTDTNLYLAHFLGPAGANKVLSAAPGTALSDLFGESTIAANKSVMSGKTTSDLIAWAGGKMGISDTELEAQQRVLDILKEKREAQDEFNKSIADGAAEREFEIEQMRRSQREQVIQAAIREARNKADEEGLTLTAQQEAAIRQSTGALFDQQVSVETLKETDKARLELLQAQGQMESRDAYIAREAAAQKINLLTAEGQEWARIRGLIYDIQRAEFDRGQVDERVNLLKEQAALLMEQITFFREMGQAAIADDLEQQLRSVNVELLKAVDAAILFYKTLDPASNPSVPNAIRAMEILKGSIEAQGKTAVVSAKQINESFAQGAANAFDRFAQAVAEGTNAWRAFQDAFLQAAADFLRQIAQMIIKAIIFRIVSGGSDSGGLGGMIAGWFNHDGGIAGREGRRGSVWGGWFANATRYHTGGVVGLKPNEIPIVAERGEEVLDMGDPRHRANGGLNSKQTINLFNYIDPAEMLTAALATPAGEKAFISRIEANAGQIKAVIG